VTDRIGGPRAAVIGAGITGLTAAHRLAREGMAVDVYERWPGLGGQVATVDVGAGEPVERYYHHLFTSDRHIAALYEELGMGGEIEWRPSSVAMFARGKTYPFVSPMDLLRFRPLSVRGRLRLGLGTLRVMRRRDYSALEDVTAADWIRDTMGVEVWETVWSPLLRGKFGDRAEEISMAWLWARITVRRRLGGGETSQELLGYPRGSWQPLLDRLREEIEARGGRVLIDRPARRLAAAGGGISVASAQPDSWRSGHDPGAFAPREPEERYSSVVATVPNDVFLGLLGDDLREAVGPGYVARLEGVEYHTALCVLLELDRPFSPYYWITVAERGIPFVGVVEQTNLVDRGRYGGRHLVYVANYVDPCDPLLDAGPDELLEIYTPGLARIAPGFSPDWVRSRMVFREPSAQPVVTVGYGDRIPPIDTGAPGLYLANTTQIYPEDRGTNYSVELGEKVAAAVLARQAVAA
jgi:protoporphyrinogen oxidase